MLQKSLETNLLNAQRGCKASYRAALDEIIPILQKFFLRRTVPRQELDEHIQETLIRVHKHLNSYLSSRPALPWIYAIARNTLFDLKKNNKKQPATVTNPLQTEYISTQGEKNIEELIADQQLLKKSLVDLPSDLLLAVRSRLADDSVKTGARRLKISQSLYKVRVHRGILKLRQIMLRNLK